MSFFYSLFPSLITPFFCLFIFAFSSSFLFVGSKVSPHLLSREQLRAWNENGFLKVKNAISKDFISKMDDITQEMTRQAELISKKEKESNGVLVHHEAVLKEKGGTEEIVRMCRIENFCSSPLGQSGWSQICFGVVQDLVGQLYGEEAVLFKDKVFHNISPYRQFEYIYI